MIIRGNEKNRAHWRTGIVHELPPKYNGISRIDKLQAVKFYLERAVKHFYPLELCDQKQMKEANKIQRISTLTKCSSNCSSDDQRAILSSDYLISFRNQMVGEESVDNI